jgi:hypothetical protein
MRRLILNTAVKSCLSRRAHALTWLVRLHNAKLDLR